MMHYLECIALLEFLQKKLFAGQRVQVPVTVVDEVQTSIIALRKRLEKENNAEIDSRIRDLMESVFVIKSTNGLINLTDAMKNTLVSGISEISDLISLLAYSYFQTHDFEPTNEIIPVMRNVVRVALAKGVL